MKILNNAEIDAWLFEHAQMQGHACAGIKVSGSETNVAWRDVVTGETIEIVFGEVES